MHRGHERRPALESPSIGPGKIVIFAALALETEAIARALGLERAGKEPTVFPEFDRVELYTVGIRAVRLPQLSEGDVSGIVLAGIGGALDPALRVGDVVIDQGGANKPVAHRFRSGRIHSSDLLIATPARKAELFRATGAGVVEMEGAVVRRLAESLGAEFVGIRAISDTGGEALEPAVLAMVDELGRPKASKLVVTLLRRPGLVTQLLRLRKNSRIAAEQLGKAIREYLEEIQKRSNDRPRGDPTSSC